ncbi:MAG: hypothetical protein RL208_32 [Pseudomonadota bacterium]
MLNVNNCHKIKKLASLGVNIINTSFILIPVAYFLPWIFTVENFYNNRITDILHIKQFSLNNPAITNYAQLIALIGDVIFILFIIYLLYNLKKIFLNYKINIIFNYQNSRNYLNMSYLLCFFALIIEPLHNMLFILAKSFTNLNNHKTIQISLSLFNFSILFLSLFLVIISYIMKEAESINNEMNTVI